MPPLEAQFFVFDGWLKYAARIVSSFHRFRFDFVWSMMTELRRYDHIVDLRALSDLSSRYLDQLQSGIPD
jgi:hypothetical protein